MPYHRGPDVKKSGPKGPSKIKGKVLEALLEEFEEHPSDPSHVIADRVTRRTGVSVAARSVRDLRHERGKSRPSMRSIMGASSPRSPGLSSYRS
jgi:transposase